MHAQRNRLDAQCLGRYAVATPEICGVLQERSRGGQKVAPPDAVRIGQQGERDHADLSRESLPGPVRQPEGGQPASARRPRSQTAPAIDHAPASSKLQEVVNEFRTTLPAVYKVIEDEIDELAPALPPARNDGNR